MTGAAMTGRRWLIVALLAAAVAAAGVVRWSSRPQEMPHQFIVSVAPGFTIEALRQELGGARLKVDALTSLQGGLHLVTVTTSDSEAEVAARLARVPGVTEVEPNKEMRLQK